jgi:5-methylcytosine-specific restriction protein A
MNQIDESGASHGDAWSDAELEAACRAYIGMLTAELKGEAFSKADVRTALLAQELKGRSEKAFDFRMGNISAVLEDAQSPWIRGYKPLRNVGAQVAEKLRSALIRVAILQGVSRSVELGQAEETG